MRQSEVITLFCDMERLMWACGVKQPRQCRYLVTELLCGTNGENESWGALLRKKCMEERKIE